MTEIDLSRRKLLAASLGAAGAMAAGILIPSGPPLHGMTVTESVYGGGPLPESTHCPYAHVGDYGVVGDGIVDDTAALQLAADEARDKQLTLYIPQEFRVKITSTVNLRHIQYIEALGLIISYVDHTHALLVGHDSRLPRTVRLYFGGVQKGNTLNPDDIGIRVVGLKNAKMTVMRCYYLQLYANAADAAATSIAYSEFYLGRVIDKLELYGEAGTSWINENIFYGGTMKNIHIHAADYAHNNNVFFKPCVEGANSIIQIDKGARNKFYDFRSEGGTNVVFGKDAYYNILIDNYISNPGNLTGSSIVSDEGTDNFCLNSVEAYYRIEDIICIDNTMQIFDEAAEYRHLNHIRGGFDCLTATSNKILFETGLFEIGESKRFRFESDGRVFRWRVYAYDENRQLLNGHLYISSIGGWVQSGDFATIPANSRTAWVLFNDTEVKYANLVILYAGPGSFEYVRLKAYLKSGDQRMLKSIRSAQAQPLVQAAMPVRGLAKVGHIVTRKEGGYWMCAERLDTQLSAFHASGSTSLAVNDTTAAEPGDIIAVLLEDRTTHWSSVVSISGLTIALAAPLPANTSVGSAVALMRWVGVGV